MSWSDDMRCLHCNGKLPLYRKLTHGQFCSTAHRKAYWQEQEQLALERLHQTHNSLLAYRPQVPVESILGPVDPAEEELLRQEELLQEVLPSQGFSHGLVDQHHTEPVPSALSGFVKAVLVPHPAGRPRIAATELVACEIHTASIGPGCPVPDPPERELPGADGVPLPWADLRPQPAEYSCVIATEPRAYDLHPVPIVLGCSKPEPLQRELPSAQAVQLNWDDLRPHPAECPRMAATDSWVFELHHTPIVLASTLAEPARHEFPTAEAVPFHAEQPRPQEGRFLATLATSELREVVIPVCRPAGEFALSAGPVATGELVKMSVTVDAAVFPASPAGCVEPLGVRVPPPITSNVRLTAAPEAQAARQIEEEFPQVDQMFPLAPFAAVNNAFAPIGFPRALGAHMQAVLPAGIPTRVQLNMAKGSRYPIQPRTSSALLAEPEPADLAVLPPEIAWPTHSAEVADQITERGIEAFVPPPSVTLHQLRFRTGRTSAKAIVPQALAIGTIPQPLQTQPIIPSSKLQPMNPPPPEAMPEVPAPVLMDARAQLAPRQQKHLWSHAAGFWKQAPRDLKILVFAIPALLVLAFHPPLPKVGFSVPAAVGASGAPISQNLQTVMAGQWASVRQAVFERAAVALEEDFRTGLDSWTSRGDATAEWSFDATGFVKPGPLALYRPSMNLRDYQMQFLGLIDKKALSWVVRAKDFDNYYVVKIMVLKPGPVTTLGITRYAVIDGVAQNRVDSTVPFDARADMLYRVDMKIHDDTFALSIQGQMADSWSEPRLAKGGIGFFNAKGEESRIRWIQITHQYDMLGRLCAYLAPYDISNTNGSF